MTATTTVTIDSQTITVYNLHHYYQRLDITQKMLDKYRRLAPLSFVEHKSLEQEEKEPTWVPRWHIGPVGFVGANRPRTLYRASAQAERHIHWIVNGTTLNIRGLRVGTITWCGEMMTFPIDDSTKKEHVVQLGKGSIAGSTDLNLLPMTARLMFS